MNKISFLKASNTQIQCCAKYCGLDELGYLNDIESNKLSKSVREKMIKKIKSFGFTSIDISNKHFIKPI